MLRKLGDELTRSEMLMRIGDPYDRAIEDYNKAIELDPKFKEAYNARGGL